MLVLLKFVTPSIVVDDCAWPAVLVLLNSASPPELTIKVAFPAVLVSKNSVNPPSFVVMVALPAVLVSKNCVNPPPLLMILALPAVLALKKFVVPRSLVMVAVAGRARVKEIRGSESVSDRRDPGGVRIKDVESVVVDHCADDRTCGAGVAQLQCARRDCGAPGVGVRAGQDQSTALENQTVPPTPTMLGATINVVRGSTATFIVAVAMVIVFVPRPAAIWSVLPRFPPV